MDDVESLLDGVWLSQVRHTLEHFMTPQQTGGRFEHFRLVLGIVLTLQARLVQRQGSLLQVADLVRGFESVPRNMLRWLLRHAGLKGWQWLIPDTALGKELMRPHAWLPGSTGTQ